MSHEDYVRLCVRTSSRVFSWGSRIRKFFVMLFSSAPLWNFYLFIRFCPWAIWTRYLSLPVAASFLGPQVVLFSWLRIPAAMVFRSVSILVTSSDSPGFSYSDTWLEWCKSQWCYYIYDLEAIITRDLLISIKSKVIIKWYFITFRYCIWVIFKYNLLVFLINYDLFVCIK